MTKDEALKLALEALEDVDGIDTETECVTIDVGEAITAIKEALAGAEGERQPEQEPVACVQDLDEVKRKHLVYEKGMDWKDPLYTTPPQRKPLTDGWILGMWPDTGFPLQVIKFARAIEAAHGITGEKT